MRFRPTPSMIVSVIAVIIALSASAFAATQITSRQIKDGSIQLKDLSRKAKQRLRTPGPRGPKGDKGDKGDKGNKGDQGDRGPAGASAFNTATIPSGVTIRGAWGGRYIAAVAGQQQNSYLLSYSFPAKAPQKLRDSDVQFGANTAGPVGDADPACTGSVADPTAPPGKVCIYSNEGPNGTRSNSTLTGFKLSAAGVKTDADAYGFEVRIVDAGTVPGTLRAEGTWAYTAP